MGVRRNRYEATKIDKKTASTSVVGEPSPSTLVWEYNAPVRSARMPSVAID